MKIPVVSKLSAANFPDQKSWLPRMLGPLNQFMGTVYLALNGKLTFGDNIMSQDQFLDFTYQSNSLPLNFLLTLPAAPKSVQVCSATENINTPVCLQVAWQYTTNNQIRITDIIKLSGGTVSSLTTGKRYQITLRICP